MYKRDLINFLYIISFPMYGIGSYFSAVKSPSAGYIISIFPHLIILLIYAIDILYQGEFTLRINSKYFLMLLFVLSSIASLFVSFNKGLPNSTLSLTVTRALLLIVPFHAFIAVVLYNDNKNNLLKLTTYSLSFLLAINLIGFFALGLSNGVHSIEGRVNFPFLDSFYSGACLLAIINLILLHYLNRAWNDPIRFAGLAGFFLVNLVLFFMINSRLTILVLALVLVLNLFGMLRMKSLFALSMFTIPILLSSGIIIYKLFQLPGLSSLMQRVDVKDVTTFNGRAFLWKDGMDWLLNGQQGLIFGNGYKGHYFLGLISDVAKLWNEKNLQDMHLHSTSMEILVSQGLVFFIIFAILFYQMFQYYKVRNERRKEEGAFFPVVVFLLFIMQIDTFLYLDNLGFVIFSFLVARVVVNKKVSSTAGMKVNKPGILRSIKLPHTGNMILTY